ncbi:MAG: hypothetical protein WAL01_14525 [Pseudolabrys sp.]
MNSTMTKIVSLADPEQRLVIYDGRIGGALGFFVARFTEEREIHQYDVADQLLFAVDREAKRSPETKRIHFPALFGKTRDRCHASMVRWASQLIWQVAKECQASPREIEAALFMWGYNVINPVAFMLFGVLLGESLANHGKPFELPTRDLMQIPGLTNATRLRAQLRKLAQCGLISITARSPRPMLIRVPLAL